MDKFLAKKQQVFSSTDFYRHVMLSNIVHLTLKAFYEHIRCTRFSTYGF